MKSKMNIYYQYNHIIVYIDGALWHFGDDELSFDDMISLLKLYPSGFDINHFSIQPKYSDYFPEIKDIMSEDQFHIDYFEEVD